MRASGLVAALLVMALAWVNSAQADAAADFGVQLPQAHKAAPAFSLPTIDGGEIRLAALRGKVVLLHFWATWCVACRQEMPQIEALWQRYRDQGVEVLAVNVDRGDAAAVRDFISQRRLSFPVVLDPDGAVRNRYAVRALPTTYAIGRDGKILGRIFGARDWGSPQATAWLNALLGQDGG